MEVKFIRISYILNCGQKNRKMVDHPAAMYATPAAANRKPVGLIAQLAERYTSITEIIDISLDFLLNIILLNPFAQNFVVFFFYSCGR